MHTSFRFTLAVAVASASASTAVFTACGGDVVLGDDTAPDAGGRDADVVDARPSEGGGDPSDDAGTDASPKATCAAAGGSCGPSGVGICKKVDATGLTCPGAADVCCLVSCPELQQPPPGFCDGGPIAQTYAANGCVNGFTCAPVACAAAGGTCVGVAPGACPSMNVGDATKYSCGGGIGTMCCLP